MCLHRAALNACYTQHLNIFPSDWITALLRGSKNTQASILEVVSFYVVPLLFLITASFRCEGFFAATIWLEYAEGRKFGSRTASRLFIKCLESFDCEDDKRIESSLEILQIGFFKLYGVSLRLSGDNSYRSLYRLANGMLAEERGREHQSALNGRSAASVQQTSLTG